MIIDNQTAVQILYKMLITRLFEQEAYRLKESGASKAPLHLSIGQEATSAAVMALSPDDAILAGHRNFHILIGAGVPPEKLFHELIGSPEGICGGKGGCFAAADNMLNFYGSSPLAASQFGKAVGIALSFKLQGKQSVVACFGGDGAAASGAFYEAINAACLHELPIVFFVENNCYAASMPTSQIHNVADIATRAAGFGIPGIVVDGNDAIAVYEAMGQAVGYSIENRIPVILESKTYRLSGHTTDDALEYRDDSEIVDWIEYDAIDNLSRYIIENGVGLLDDLIMMRERIEAEMQQLSSQALLSMQKPMMASQSKTLEGANI
ncbi:MAG: thiamine pyrophosphate-dependent dehydrogenase E1 component subunit alpha [Eubacteriaceae bacterium]|nr:thiamine pyrophosphate-dependent dehydrogenase E1 component subunit alpha [Eubacteriaceae bacterium]